MIEIHLRIAQIPDTPNQRPILMFARIELNEQNARLQEVSLG